MQALAILNRPSADAPPHHPGMAAFELADPEGRHLSVLDLGATRGDGIFETINVASGTAQALEPHLARFARSAAALDLPTPDLDVWRQAILAVADVLAEVSEASVKTVYTRGIEGDGRPTGWVYGTAAADFTRARTEGIRVVTLDRGYRHDVAITSPWLLADAKTLSYAVNRAVLREAERRAADDVIFISSDGYVLEGPSSSVLIRRGNTLITPGTGLAILEGTTQGSIFEFAASRGMQTEFALAPAETLRQADALWLVSSTRLAAPVVALDGMPMPVDRELTAAMNRYLAARTA
ncbi:MAG TPA: aminodeoxychorismate lyase [Homoserinimonas sp.]|nr:aminodeoxychorismate lyase [Homoserinimonas sp.]